jgi:hypothetical protein
VISLMYMNKKPNGKGKTRFLFLLTFCPVSVSETGEILLNRFPRMLAL